MLPREGWEGLPLYALGASSGGAFVLALAAEQRVAEAVRKVRRHGVVCELAAVLYVCTVAAAGAQQRVAEAVRKVHGRARCACLSMLNVLLRSRMQRVACCDGSGAFAGAAVSAPPVLC